MKMTTPSQRFVFPNQRKKFSRASSSTQRRTKIASLHIGVKGTLVIVAAIIAIMLISVFAVMQNAAPTGDIVPVKTIDPTTNPSPTNETTTPGATLKPKQTSQPNNNGPSVPTIEIQYQAPPKAPGIIERAQKMNSSVWKEVAFQAWRYFQPGIGIDPNTGLPGSVSGYPYFTDWDLGVYIQAVIDAYKIGLNDSDGWTDSKRFDKVLIFLETRPLNTTTGYPFWFYQSGNGDNFPTQSDLQTVPVDVVDAGRLLVALNNLRVFRPNLASRIDNIVLHGPENGRTDYASLLPDIRDQNTSNSIYAYYFGSGFAAFWPEVSFSTQQMLDNIVNSPPTVVNAGGKVTLPNAELTCEPLLHSIFELGYSPNSSQGKKLLDLSRRVYDAHEEKFNITYQKTEEKIYAAYSEGNSGTDVFIYEWVVLPGVGTWKVTTINRQICEPFNTYPIIYSKVALSFLALYNTGYAKDTCVYLEKCCNTPTIGWCDGADYKTTIESRNIVNSVGSNTNGMILEAASYYIQHPI